MVECSCYIKTILDNAFFAKSEDEDFLDWLADSIPNSAKNLELTIDTPEIDGVYGINVSINDLIDYDHETTVTLKIDTELSEDDIADYDVLFDFMEKQVVPQFIAEFNDACDLMIPMNSRDNFDDMVFKDNEFYVQCYPNGNEYKLSYIQTVPFQLIEDFQIIF